MIYTTKKEEPAEDWQSLGINFSGSNLTQGFYSCHFRVLGISCHETAHPGTDTVGTTRVM